jgi:aspartyl-tRNA(Asn)/glutamyl-tRNA(Gln) amidotransferase subunit A
MARTIADCSALLATLAAGGAAITALAPPPAPMGELTLAPRAGSAPLAGVTVALTDRSERIDLHPRSAAALEAARSACEALGARVVHRPAPWAGDMDAVGVVLMTEAWGYHARHRSHHGRYRPSIAEFLEIASAFGDVGAYLAAQEGRAEGTALWERWFEAEGIDLVLEPTLPVVPFARGDGYERGHAGGPGDPMIALTALWDMTGMPVAALPVTWDAGVSLIAPRGREAALVAAAIDLQEHALGVPAWEPGSATP